VKTFLALLLLQVASVAVAPAEEKPKDGFVPDAATAIKIAVAVWERIYSASEIAQEKPYCAYLKEDTWIVTGTLPDGFVGGVARAEIAKKDGCVISVSHSE
jgi:hypothetical protein